MRPSLALSIGAAVNILIGLPLVLAPALLLSSLGFATTAEVQARDAGVAVIGLGIINWLGAACRPRLATFGSPGWG